MKGCQQITDEIPDQVVCGDHPKVPRTLHQGAEQCVGVHGAGSDGRKLKLHFLEHAHPKAVPVLQHVGFVGQGQRRTQCFRPLESSPQQTENGCLGMNRKIRSAMFRGFALQAISPLGVFPEYLHMDIRSHDPFQGDMDIQHGCTGAVIHAKPQILPQAQQNILGMAAVRHPWVAHGAQKNRVKGVPEAHECFVRESLSRIQEMIRAMGKNLPFDLPVAVPGPLQQG